MIQIILVGTDLFIKLKGEVKVEDYLTSLGFKVIRRQNLDKIVAILFEIENIKQIPLPENVQIVTNYTWDKG